MLKGKIAWVYRHELERLAPELGVDFITPEGWYDVLEEHFSNLNFNLLDDDIEFVSMFNKGQFTVFKYNCIVFYTVKREDRFIIHKIGFVYMGINNPRMDDLAKLCYALNHLKPFAINGVPEPDGLKAQEYLRELIEKMKESQTNNIKS